MNNLFTNLVDGIVSPGRMARYSDCELTPTPLAISNTIEWKKVAVNDIKILSFQGKLVKQIPTKGLKGEKIIDVNGLAPGIYFVNIGNTMKKLIVQ